MLTNKAQLLSALEVILPSDAKVADMLAAWRGADARYWNGALSPCWMTANIAKYGSSTGTWSPCSRTINLIPSLWNHDDELSTVAQVLVHETCHQAQTEFYRDLDSASGPSSWFDRSHRCPSWSRACEDVIQAEGMDVFVPVWHRSTGNRWHPWVPDSSDWMKWRKVQPDDTFDGRRLLSKDDAMRFEGNKTLSFSELCDSYCSNAQASL